MAKARSSSAGMTVARYLAAQPPATRAALVQVRAAIRKALPGAEELISYRIPAYRLHGRVVLFFAGWRTHYSLYPVTESDRDALGPALAKYEHSKGTLRFPLDRRVPVALIARIARLRAAESSLRARASAKPRPRPKRRTR